jgi:Co/Zn/Cd efflux system component
MLAVVFGLEVYGLKDSGNLVLLTHLADVGSDLGFYGLVFLVASLSWWQDRSGRPHEHNHPEEVLAGGVNLFLLGLGLLIALIGSLRVLGEEQAVNNWSAAIAPSFGLALYLVIYLLVQNEDLSFSKSLVDAHLLGDLATTLVVVILSVSVVMTDWKLLNPLGALMVIPILGAIFFQKLLEFRRELGTRKEAEIKAQSEQLWCIWNDPDVNTIKRYQALTRWLKLKRDYQKLVPQDFEWFQRASS